MGKIGFFLYAVAMYLLLPAVFVRYLCRGVRRPVYLQRMAERFAVLPASVGPGSIWIHAVSVGEVNAAAPLVKRLLHVQDNKPLITCVTPTGSAQIQKTFSNRVQHVYAPIDAGPVIRKFLSHAQPRALIIMETELWPNLVHVCRSRRVPVMFANMRISDQTYRTAKRLKPLFNHVMNDVNAFCVQTETDANRVISLGVDSAKVHVTGNLKFDMEVLDEIRSAGEKLRDRWGGVDRPTIILGSSHEGEESLFLDVFKQLREEFPQLVCIIVPRHPERFDSVHNLIANTGLSVVRRTRLDQINPSSIDVVLVDVMGELVKFYAAADIAVVGGSFAAFGGHNILEPIAVETPVVFGPDMSNFREISRLTVSSEAGTQVQNAIELRTVLSELLNNSQLRAAAAENAKRLLATNRGALDRTFVRLHSVLES